LRRCNAVSASIFACGVSNAGSSWHFHVQIAVTARLKIFFIYETPEITASILFASQSKTYGQWFTKPKEREDACINILGQEL
jgi:hypothetical protein